MNQSRKPLYMVICCTLFASVAQILLGMGVRQLPAGNPGLPLLIEALVRDVPLIVGFFFHACNALLLILALRDGELSILWPVYALSYVWVALLSMHFFGDRMNVWNGAGIGLIIVGVGLLGRANERAGGRA
jgi:multidrug transporter EmrE-like cation transporter